MDHPSDITVKTYQERFSAYKDRAALEVSGEFKVWMDTFSGFLTPKGRILELGSATGRDARYFRDQGFQVTCSDIVPEALEQLAADGFETRFFDFQEEVPDEWHQAFDGFFANAVLLHAPADVLDKCLADMVKILKPGGTAAFSLKLGSGDEVTDDKMGAGRYFMYHDETSIRSYIGKYPLEILELSTSAENKWLRLIIKSRG